MGLIEDLNKTQDEILQDILTDYNNQDPDIDTSQGSLTYIKAAAMAAVSWNLRQLIKYEIRQIFPDTASDENLEHHANVYGIYRSSGDTYAELLADLLDRMRYPPAGGNNHDYGVWAKEVTNVKNAWCYSTIYGNGTVGIVIQADSTATGSEIPSSHTAISGTNTTATASKLIDSGATFISSGVKVGDVVNNDTTTETATVTALDGETTLSLSSDIFTATSQAYSIDSLTTQVRDYVAVLDPVAADELWILPMTAQSQAVTMTVTGTVDKAQIATDITAFLNTMIPDQVLYLSKLTQLAMRRGATNATISVPASNVTPTAKYSLRAGAISVT